MGESDLLDMLAAETNRRAPKIIAGLEELAGSDGKNPEKIEELRVEAHGLKGAALVIGQSRLAELGERVEIALVQRIGPGTIDPGLAARMVAAISALQEGAQAAAEGGTEPPTVGAAISELRAKPDSGSAR
jgi:HPt (histidine-containing phosphotransfer) domain-containing protein